ncbi:MAG: 16S rRNA (guanine(966)-N(2))-methyltransferase RsmD [Clostridiaceae bacterium]|jgi:16S rRNA (guanine(966)-N(2))-methyltransferase RsmD|nr:16S rRNA (guanine(966)-N(2))-methyltransferase RsmD [Clostridiaceae bacterium]
MLRVIAGSARGHKLKTLKGVETRPTSDKVKESVFNIIAADIADSNVLDAFAGTGSLGIEALSRGAKKAVFMDKSAISCGIIRENLVHTNLRDQAEVYVTDYKSGIERLCRKGYKFSVVFLDPPYNKNFIQEALKLVAKNDIIDNGGIIVAEHSHYDDLPESCDRLKAVDTRKYGDTMITIYKLC